MTTVISSPVVDGLHPLMTVYVVLYHQHIDDYKRAESCSGIRHVFRNIISAYKVCILRNLVYFTETDEYKGNFTLNMLGNTLGKLIKGNRQKVTRISADTISTMVQSLTDVNIVEQIHEELLSELQAVDGEYTMLPSQTVYTVHTKTIED